MILDWLFFIVRYTPWWSIPIMIISAQFGYIYWLKDIPRVVNCFALLAGISFLFLIYYVWAGSPENAAGYLDEFFRHF